MCVCVCARVRVDRDGRQCVRLGTSAPPARRQPTYPVRLACLLAVCLAGWLGVGGVRWVDAMRSAMLACIDDHAMR